MKTKMLKIWIGIIFTTTTFFFFSNALATNSEQDTTEAVILSNYLSSLEAIIEQRRNDSIMVAALKSKLDSLQPSDDQLKEELNSQLNELNRKKEEEQAQRRVQIERFRQTATGYPVIGGINDTIFLIFTRIGGSTAEERAASVSNRIALLIEDDFLEIDSLKVVESVDYFDIMYKNMIIMSVSEIDAIWHNTTKTDLAQEKTQRIKTAIIKAKDDRSILKITFRILMVLLVVAVVWLVIKLINKANDYFVKLINDRKEIVFRDLSYKDYTFISTEQELSLALFFIKIIKWFLIILLFYLAFPVVFSIFPFTRGWATILFELIWSPFIGVFKAIWDFLPNIFYILVIFFVMRYFIRFVKYIFQEIESEKLTLSGFHPDWAMPTFGLVRILLYAFMFVLIFPYLPGSDSNIFKGVSVFIGVLFSLGSSSAISNMIAGLVITYMRPFKIGDRIKIGDMTGDVIEKTVLVTRLRTTKNEEITIPNSSVLTGNTINYSTFSKTDGLIIHTSVTIGYDVPWKNMHQALIDAALKTRLVLNEPMPFVLQTSLDDFYISYQLNVYTREANRQAVIYSELHQNIQDVCNERGIEIMSPHYRAARDGNMTTIPNEYLPENFEPAAFNVKIKKD
jgi:small-conductance mechanosensitive channel